MSSLWGKVGSALIFSVLVSGFSTTQAQPVASAEVNAKLTGYWNGMERILFSPLPADTTVAVDCHQLDSAIFYFYDYLKAAKNVLPPQVFKTKAVYYLLELQTRFRDIYLRNPQANYCYREKNYTILGIAAKLDPGNMMIKNNLLLFNSEIQRLEHNKTIALLKDAERENALQQDSLKRKAEILLQQESRLRDQENVLDEQETKLKHQEWELIFNEKKILQQRKTLSSQVSKIESQYLVISLFVAALLLLIMVLFLVVRSLRTTRRQKNIIELQKNEVLRQKEIVDGHQKEIIDSIRYAKRIQNAMLKEQEHVSLHLPEHFVLFKPKDIVSGDFYWSMEKGDFWYLAEADCTGHGVPGGFLTMIGTAFLNEINASAEVLSPAEILNRLRARFIKELGQKGIYGESNDGMDISLCLFDRRKVTSGTGTEISLQWAGANSPLFLIRGSELIEVNPNKQPIGYVDKPEPFANHSFLLGKGDIVIISSDGYADQFGENDKKLKKRVFKELLFSIRDKAMAEQKKHLEKFHADWKGDLMQTDDICVIGIRI